MWGILSVLTLGLAIVLDAATAPAQSVTAAPTWATVSTQAVTTTHSSASAANAPQGAFDALSPGGKKIAMTLCNG